MSRTSTCTSKFLSIDLLDGGFFNFKLTVGVNCGIIYLVEKRKRLSMKRRVDIMYKRKCKECGGEMLAANSKEEKCWECKQKFRKKWRKSSVNWNSTPSESEH